MFVLVLNRTGFIFSSISIQKGARDGYALLIIVDSGGVPFLVTPSLTNDSAVSYD